MTKITKEDIDLLPKDEFSKKWLVCITEDFYRDLREQIDDCFLDLVRYKDAKDVVKVLDAILSKLEVIKRDLINKPKLLEADRIDFNT